MNNVTKLSFIALLLVIVDQVTKALFYNRFYGLGILDINFVRNTGISFGLLKGTNAAMIIISVAVLVLLWTFRKEFRGKELFLAFIASGTVGNLIDRIFRGYVVDFIDFRFFPVFNVADALLTIGVAGFIIATIIEEARPKRIHDKKASKK